MALPDPVPCRYCKKGKAPNYRSAFYANDRGQSVEVRFYKMWYDCPESTHARTVLREKESTDQRLMIKDWNASNDLNGPDIVEPAETTEI